MIVCEENFVLFCFFQDYFPQKLSTSKKLQSIKSAQNSSKNVLEFLQNFFEFFKIYEKFENKNFKKRHQWRKKPIEAGKVLPPIVILTTVIGNRKNQSQETDWTTVVKRGKKKKDDNKQEQRNSLVKVRQRPSRSGANKIKAISKDGYCDILKEIKSSVEQLNLEERVPTS